MRFQTFESLARGASKIYVQDLSSGGGAVLWSASSPGSGYTRYFFDLKELTKSYITDKESDKNSDPTMVKQFLAWKGTQKPVKVKGSKEVYEIPVYRKVDKGTGFSGASNYENDVFYGREKPIEKVYALVSPPEVNEAPTVIGFFKSLKEVIAFMN